MASKSRKPVVRLISLVRPALAPVRAEVRHGLPPRPRSERVLFPPSVVLAVHEQLVERLVPPRLLPRRRSGKGVVLDGP